MSRWERKAVSTGKRFRIFQRDGFRCVYCGRTPPAVVLHVDHVTPVAEGGGNEDENLCTACADCNLGKSSRPLEAAVPRDYAALADEAQERAEQLRRYREYLASLRTETDAAIDMVGAEFWGEGYTWDRERGAAERVQVERFLGLLDLESITRAARIARARVPDGLTPAASRYVGSNRFSYFCGVFWNMCTERGIRGDASPATPPPLSTPPPITVNAPAAPAMATPIEEPTDHASEADPSDDAAWEAEYEAARERERDAEYERERAETHARDRFDNDPAALAEHKRKRENRCFSTSGKRRWGRWRLEGNYLCITPYEGVEPYEIYLGDLTTPDAPVDWELQIEEKRWATPEDVRDLKLAFGDLGVPDRIRALFGKSWAA